MAALVLPRLGVPGPERAEIYFMDGARGMVETGDWLVPYYRGEPFFDKPPLTYWLIAAAFQLFGITAGAARLVSALAAVAAVAATVMLGRAIGLRASAALAGGLLVATTHAFVSFGRIAMSDMLLTLFSTTAVALGAWPVEPSRARLRAAGVGVVLGLGFITKGPIAVMFPLVGLAALAWTRGERRLSVPPLLIAAAAGLAVAVPWFALVYARLGVGPLVYFFLRENLQRFAGATYDSQRPFWYYAGAYLMMGLPWAVFIVPVVARALRTPEARAARGLLLWAAVMLVPLSLSRGKIDYYLLPLLPGASLAIAAFFTDGEWSRREGAYARSMAMLLAVMLVALAFAPWILPAGWRPPDAVAWPMALALSLLAVALLATVHSSRAKLAVGIAAASAAAHLAAVVGLIPAFVQAQPNERVLADITRELRYRPDAGFAFCSDPTRVARDVLFQARLAGLETCDHLWAAAGGKLPFLILANEQERQSLKQIEFVRDIGEYEYLHPTALSALSAWRRPSPSRLFLMANFETEEPVAMERWRRERRRDLGLVPQS